jgi:DUF2891 family protein
MTQLLPALSMELAAQLARIALSGVTREYPNHPNHVVLEAGDLRRTRELHPAFYGCFDWHSAVHSHWLLARLLRLRPALPEATPIRSVLNEHLTETNLRAEAAYFGEPGRRGFERPYGWAWLLMLQAELARHGSEEGRRWAATVAPLADAFAARFRDFLPKATYPIRNGSHTNTAFALILALDYAEAAEDAALRALIGATARGWYAGDRDAPAWEPGGDDFLSPTLVEAECLRRVLPAPEFAAWLGRFLPRLAECRPATLFAPATVSDRSDGKIVHLDGLNLSRAWCWRSLGAAFAADDPRRAIARDAAETHLAASLPHVAGDYMGEHWLATYAVLALLADVP